MTKYVCARCGTRAEPLLVVDADDRYNEGLCPKHSYTVPTKERPTPKLKGRVTLIRADLYDPDAIRAQEAAAKRRRDLLAVYDPAEARLKSPPSDERVQRAKDAMERLWDGRE